MKRLNWRRLPARALAVQPGLQTAWDRLNESRLNLPFLSSAAMVAALAAFGDGTEILLTGEESGHDADRQQAMFLLCPDGAMRWRTFQPSQLPLGAWVAAPQRELLELARSAMRAAPGLCLVLSVTQVDPLMAPRLEDAPDCRHGDYIETAWVDIRGSFDDYWAQRGKNLRQNLRKQRNKLAAEGTATVMRVLTEPAEMAGAIERYGELESSGWKGQSGTAIHPGNAQGRFYTRLLEEAAGQGEARVYEYLFDGRSVAINLCLLRAGVLCVLKTAYDEKMPSSLSPASLLREEEFRLFHGGVEVRRLEYYGRVMDWHSKLTEHHRGLYHLTAYRWPLIRKVAQRRQTALQAEEPPPEAANGAEATKAAESTADTAPAADKAAKAADPVRA